MEILKQTSVRLSKEDIKKADAIGSSLYFGGRSFVIRAALWIGLKILSERNILKIVRLMDEEKVRSSMKFPRKIRTEDVLRAADVSSLHDGVETTFSVSLPSSVYDKLKALGCKDGDKLLITVV